MSLSLRAGGVRVTLSFWFLALVAFFALLDHNALVYYIALPILIHEAGHLLAMPALKIAITEIRFTAVSIDIKTRGANRLSYGGEMLLAASGIAANLLAAFLLWKFAFQSMRTMLMIASNMVIAFFNLLPVGSLDGGQMVRCLCGELFPPSVARGISLAVSFAVLVPLTALAGWLLLRGQVNFTLVLTCVYLIVTVILRE